MGRVQTSAFRPLGDEEHRFVITATQEAQLYEVFNAASQASNQRTKASLLQPFCPAFPFSSAWPGRKLEKLPAGVSFC